DVLVRDHRPCAGAVLGQHLLRQAFAQLLRDDAADDVDVAAGRKADDQADRLRRIVLGGGKPASKQAEQERRHPHQSARMLLSFTTLPERCIWESSHAANPSGVPTTRSMPSVSVRSLRTSGRLKARTSSAWNLSMTGLGVPAGANTPHHASAENPGSPCSASAGTSGSARERVSPVTAIARSLPPVTWGVITATEPIARSIWPPTA